MLKELQKALGITPKVEATAPTLEVKISAEDVQAAIAVAVESLRAEFDEYKQTAEAMVAAADEQVALLKAEIETLGQALTATETALAEAQAALDAADEEAMKAAAEAAAAKLEARKEKVIGIVGTERADALLKVTEGMDDAAFEAVVAALGVGVEAEAKAPLFKEVGVDAEADTAKVVGETAEMRILKNKYGKK